jgi:hypothetical protein
MSVAIGRRIARAVMPARRTPGRGRQKTRRLARLAGFSVPLAFTTGAGENLALAAFVTRPQAEASNRREIQVYYDGPGRSNARGPHPGLRRP